MKPQLPYLATLLLFILMSGCKSNDPTTGTTTVSGQVVTFKSNKPVPNPWVQLYHQTAMGNYAAIGQPYKGDAQGKFSFSFEATDKYGYEALATAAPGYSTAWGLAAQVTAGRANDGVVIQAYAPAWYKIQLVNSSRQKQYSINIQGYASAAIGDQGDFFYNPKDTVLLRPTTAIYQQTGVSWFITDLKGGSFQGHQDTNPAPLDTVLVRIPF